MVRPPVSRCLLRLPLTAALLALTVSSLAQSLSGQSSKKQTYRLEVLSAEYVPEKNMVEYKVVNHGKSAVSAYNVGVVVLADGKEVYWGGTGLDLLDQKLLLECSDVATGPEAANSMHGAIQPGEIFAGSIQLTGNGTLNGAVPEVRASVTGVIWVDSKIEGNPDGPGGIADMNRFRDMRMQEAAEEEKVLAIMNAHPEDDDIQHRISEVISGLEVLSAEYPGQNRGLEQQRASQPGVRISGQRSPILLSNTIVNLKAAAASPVPKEMFAFFSGLWTCEHQRRVAMLGHPATVAKFAQ